MSSRETPLNLRSHALFDASFERRADAEALFAHKRWTLCIYVAGLAVECVLQAIALRHRAELDARHDLALWLTRCPNRVSDRIQANAPNAWSFLRVCWENRLRYLSDDAALGYLRAKGLAKGLKLPRRGADPPRETVLRANASLCLQSARLVHDTGVLEWLHEKRRT